MKKFFMSIFLTGILLLTGCNNGNTDVQKQDGNLRLMVMDEEVEYPADLSKIIAVGYENAEIITILGLEDKLVGLTGSMYTPEQVYPDLYEKIKSVPVMSDGKMSGVPNLEDVLSSGADFVYCMSWHVMPDAIGTTKDLKDNGISYYIMRGTYGDNIGLDALYEDISNIGKIFNIEDKANKVIGEYKAQIEEVSNKVSGLEKKDVFVFDFQDKSGIMTAGKKSFANSLIEISGGRNIFEDYDVDFDIATIEQLIERNPEYIIFVEYSGGTDKVKNKIEYLESLPELSEVAAIKNKNYIALDGIEYFPSLHNIDAIQKIASTLHPTAFEK